MNEQEQRIIMTILKDTEPESMGYESRRLLIDAGFKFKSKPRVDFADVSNAPLRIRFQRNSTVATDLLEDRSDLAILGLDMINEADPSLIPLMPLGFSKCGLYLGVRDDVTYNSPQDLEGRRVATSYLVQTQRYFDQQDVKPTILYRPGGEESFVREGNAEACVVIFESGASFEANQITARGESLVRSEAYLVASPYLGEKRGSEGFVRQLLTRVLSTIRSRDYIEIVMNTPMEALDNVVNLLPSAESPTITPLEKKGWVAISSLIPQARMWDLTFPLQDAGARDIFTQEIKQVVPNADDPDINKMMGMLFD